MARCLRPAALSWIVLLLLCTHSMAQTPPRLWVMGSQVSFGQPVTITLTSDAIGAPVLLALGLSPLPLDAPIVTAKGPLYFQQLLLAFPFGVIPASGRIDVTSALPPADPALEGIHVVMQGFGGGKLSNPATVPLVQPYFKAADAVVINCPVPQQAGYFGDRLAIGDLNNDGQDDLVAGAWISTVNGKLGAGVAYVLWGPDFTSFVQLVPPSPAFAAGFGGAVLVDDLDGDGVDDLAVTQSTGSPANGKSGYFYIYYGGPSFSSVPGLVIPSIGTGADYLVYGRAAAAGDVNGDGFNDLVAGVTNARLGLVTNAGRIDVFLGPSFTQHQSISSSLPQKDDFFGSGLALGDVTGDGMIDLVEGSGRTDVGGEVNIGRMEVFRGPSLTLEGAIDCPLPDGFNTRFGSPVILIDEDGSGVLKIQTRDDRDHAFVHRTSGIDDYVLILRPRAVDESLIPSETFADDSSAVGDVDRDGYLDLILPDAYAGPATNCGLSSKGGWVYLAHGPYYATFDRFWDFQPSCDEIYGAFVLYGPAVGRFSHKLLVSNPSADDNGFLGSGHVIIYK